MTPSKYTTIALNDNEKQRLDEFATNLFEESETFSYADVVKNLTAHWK